MISFIKKYFYRPLKPLLKVFAGAKKGIVVSDENISLETIKKMKSRYQPIILPNGEVIEKKCSNTIIDSREKLKKIFLPTNLSGKTLLDIGCAEGFFLREAVKRGCRFAKGVDIRKERVIVASFINKLWGFADKIKVTHSGFVEEQGQYDIVLCLAIIHHYQKTEQGTTILDTWAMITDSKYEYVKNEHLKTVRKVASLTKDITIFEYAYRYEGYKTKREDIDFELLGKLWVENGIYNRVEFKGLSQKSKSKDRAIYLAYK